jgi:protein-disulfide isomerase
MKRYLPFAIIGVVLLVALGAVVMFVRRDVGSGEDAFTPASNSNAANANATTSANQPISNSNATSNSSAVSSNPANVPVDDAPHVRGKANAPVLLEEYGDFQCPPCGLIYFDLKKIEAEYGDKLRVVFHNFPLTVPHKNAQMAAQAAEAAGFQNHFWEMHDQLYQNQSAWKDSTDARTVFIDYARQLGLDIQRFTRDIDSPQAAARVAADHAKGVSLGVDGTPTIFIDGRQLRVETTNPDGIRKAIDYMLNQKPANQKAR